MSKTAIVLAAFGASLPEALPGISNVFELVKQTFACPVEVCFTSNIVRSIWRKRLADHEWLANNPPPPEYVAKSKGPLAAIAALQEEGYKTQIIQPLHIYAGEEFHDLKNCVSALADIQTIKAKWRPFSKLALGRPALGAPGTEHPYIEDLKRAVEALQSDVHEARDKGAALVYVGHGNHLYSTGVYQEMQQLLQQRYPEVPIQIGAVEGIFGIGYVASKLNGLNVKRVLLKPLMVVAGVHARDDMAGDAEDSWRSVLGRAGFEVECTLRGLGENQVWAEIYLRHILECAQDADIELSRNGGKQPSSKDPAEMMHGSYPRTGSRSTR